MQVLKRANQEIFMDQKRILQKIKVRQIPGGKVGRVLFFLWFVLDVFLKVVVSKIFCVHPYLGNIPSLTNIFQLG